MIKCIHHIAIIVSDVDRSLTFYEDLLGFSVLKRTFREERQSWKIDMVKGEMQLELFTFPHAPNRPSRPEALGLRHLAFGVDNLLAMMHRFSALAWPVEPIREDALTGKRFFFTSDPDGLPIEFYEA